MKNIRTLIMPFLPLLLLLTCLAGTSSAALLDVGPRVPEVIPSTPPQHGYPLWYRDQNRLPLEICLSTAPSPNAPGSNMCNLLAGPTYDPALPLTFPTNFPDEAFWWATEATIREGNVRGLLVLAIEGAWNTGEIVSGQQISFARMRIMVDAPVAGTYRVVFPYGERTFTDVPAGVHAIFHTEDIGIQLGNFEGALQGGAGPFLSWDSGIPINVNGELFIGDPNIEHTITGSPLGTNYFRIEGPTGSNLDGLGNDFVQTNLFAVTGKIHTEPISTPLTVDKAVYARDPAGAQVSVFATTQPVANPTNDLAPFPGNYALLGTPSALQAAGTGIPTTPMETNVAADGKFFSATGLFADPGTLPATVAVTNSADIPPTTVAVPLVDEVTVSQATYLPLTRTLTIDAASSDRVSPPALQAFMPGMTASLGTLTAGQLLVNFPVTDSSVTPAAVFETPPLTVTVRSAVGGELTVPVVVKDQVDLPPTGSIVINGGAAMTKSAAATLTLSATDDSGIVAQMQFSRDGVTWTRFEAFNTTRNVSLIVVPGDGVKTIYVRFKDGNGNVSASYSDTIILDTTAPTGSILIDGGAIYSSSLIGTLNLSASDANGVSFMQFSRDGVTWLAAEPYATTRSVKLSLVAGDGTKTFYVRYIDALGNVSAPVSDSIIQDTALPTGTIAINGGAALTNMVGGTLSLSASDANGVPQMQLSRDGVAWLDLEPFNATRAVNLALVPGDGVKTFYVRFKDGAGRLSAALNDSIIYDTTPPTGTIQINGGAASTTSRVVTLTLSASDANGVSQMQFSKDGGATWFAWETYAASRNVTLTAGAGSKTIDVRFKDLAGNISAGVQASITLQ